MSGIGENKAAGGGAGQDQTLHGSGDLSGCPIYSDVDKSGKPEEWIRQFQRFGNWKDWDEAKRMKAVPMALRGAASTWFTDLEDALSEMEIDGSDGEHPVKQPTKNWKDFQSAFIAHFTDPARQSKDLDLIMSIEQRGTEPIENYIDRFHAIARTFRGSKLMSEEALIKRFRKSIHEGIRFHMSTQQEPKTLEAAYSQAKLSAVEGAALIHVLKQQSRSSSSNYSHNSGTSNYSGNRYGGTGREYGNRRNDNAGNIYRSRDNGNAYDRGNVNYNNYNRDNQRRYNNESSPNYTRRDDRAPISNQQSIASGNGNSGSSPVKQEPGTGSTGAAVRCFNCNAPGHYSRDCPEPRKPRGSPSNGNTGPGSFKSSSGGVRAVTESPPPSPSSDGEESIESEGELEDVTDLGLLSPVIIGDHYQVLAFVDTACSKQSVMSESIYRAMESKFKDKYPLQPVDHDGAAGVEGSSIGVIGTVTLPIKHVKDHADAEPHMVEFRVARKMVPGMLLGLQYLRKFTRGIDFETNKLRLKSGAEFELIDLHPSIDFNTRNVHNYKPYTINMVQLKQGLTLPPRTQALVFAKAVIDATTGDDTDVLFEPKSRTNGMIGRILFTPSSENVHVSEITGSKSNPNMKSILFPTTIINTKPYPIHISARECIGTLVTDGITVIEEPEAKPVTSVGIELVNMVTSENQTKALTEEEQALITAIEAQIETALTNEQRQALVQLIFRYRHLIAENPKGPTFTTTVEHVIETGTHPPIKQRPYRLAQSTAEKASKEVKEMLENGIIRHSNSPWASPVVMVPKKDGSTRFCVDYRKLNAITVKDSYPLPLICETLDTLTGAVYFSSMDFASGYWQIPVRAEDVRKTAFVTKDGLFEFTRMPFGLVNAPATFQRTMDLLLSGLTWKMCMVYIDDVLVFSRTFDEHLQHLETVFERLSSAGFCIKLSKCHFGKRQVAYLGHVISDKGVKPDPDKIKAAEQFPIPQNLTGVRSFLGLMNYYHRFIPQFAITAEPLYRLGKKGVVFNFNADCIKAFNTLKQKLIESPILRYPDFKRPFILHCDASDNGIGAVLSQEDGDGNEYAVAYESRTLSAAERKYTVTEKECLAVIHATRKFRPYIHGQAFTVITDHGSLTWLFRLRDPEGRLGRWSLKLQGLNMRIEHRAGTRNGNADGFSRQAVNYVYAFTPINPPINAVTRSRAKKTDSASQSTDVTAPGPPDASVSILPQPAAPPVIIDKPAVTVEQKGEEKQSDQSNIRPPSTEDILVQAWSEQRKTIHNRVIEEQTKDPQWCDLITYLRSNQLPTDDAARANRIREMSSNYVLKDGVLYRNWVDEHMVPHSTMVVPSSLRHNIMTAYHSSYIGGHYGTRRTYMVIKLRYWWPNMHKDVDEFCKSCIECQQRKTAHRQRNTVRLTTMIAYYPFHKLGIDVVGPFPISISGNKYIVVITDAFTKWVEAWPVDDQREETIAQLLVEHIVCRFGCPESLLSDRGTNFLSALSMKVYELLQINKKTTTAYRPQTNGVTERFNGTLVDMLSIYATERDWDAYIPYVLCSYRATPHATTGFSPHFLVFGREMRLPNDVLNGVGAEAYETNDRTDYAEEMAYRLHHAYKTVAAKYATLTDKREQLNAELYNPKQFKVGDKVWLFMPQPPTGTSSKLYKPWRGPYQIIGAKGALNYKLDIPAINGQAPHEWVHVARLKPYYDPSSTSAARAATSLEALPEHDIDRTIEQNKIKPKKRGVVSFISMIRHARRKYGSEERIVVRNQPYRQIIGRDITRSMCVEIQLGSGNTTVKTRALLVDNWERTVISRQLQTNRLLMEYRACAVEFDRSDPCRTVVITTEVELPLTFLEGNERGTNVVGVVPIEGKIHFDVLDSMAGPLDYDVVLGRDFFAVLRSQYRSCEFNFRNRTLIIETEYKPNGINIQCYSTRQAYTELSIELDDQRRAPLRFRSNPFAL